jgi:DNA-binding CsgD family transcriptional regulator
MEREMVWSEGMLEAFTHVGWGAILISTEGRVVGINGEAQQRVGCDFLLTQGQIAPMHRNSNGELQRLIASALLAENEASIPKLRDAVLLQRPRGRPLMAYAIPIRASEKDSARHVKAVVVFIDPDKRREPTASLLQRMFGLTPAETQVALRLARGCDLQEIASDQAVSLATVRAYLKGVFAKTETRRQAELTMLLVRLAQQPQEPPDPIDISNHCAVMGSLARVPAK